MVADDELVEVRAEYYAPDVPLPPLYAHFFSKTARKSAELVFTHEPSLCNIQFTALVADKREARAYAEKLSAMAWNF